jgi:tetratricopeptide (TPR) repeat protein
MLNAFTKNKIEKQSQKAGTNLKKGVVLLKGKLYKQAVIELKLALELDMETSTLQLETMFSDFFKARDLEASLSVGLVLLTVRTKDFELANRVGNIARKLHNFKQANNLYKQSLRINKSFIKAYYNLAASMGKVDKFDLDVKKSIEQFASFDNYVLPDYQNDQKIVSEMMGQWEEKNKDTRESISEVRENIANHLRQAVKENWKKYSNTEGKIVLQGDIYNMGLFALSCGDSLTAMENFTKLKKQNSKIPYLDMIMALSSVGMGNGKKAVAELVALLGENQFDRYLNFNLGLLYKKIKNRLLSFKFLSIAASLLEKSEGQFSHTDILKIADGHFENGNLKKSLFLYKLVKAETPNIHAITRIGEIYLTNNNYTEAVVAFKAILAIEPDSQFALQKLKDIHDHYVEKADEVIKDKKIAQAIVLYERALTIERVPETIEKTAKLYIRLKKNEKSDELMEEIEELKKKKLQSIQEEKRRIHVTKGKAYLKKKDFTKAIENFENAFSLRMDKDVFVYLAHIYKGLKRTNALNYLLQRWQQASERQEKEKMLEKEREKEREKGRERVNALTKKNQPPDFLNQPPEMTINLFD